MVASFLRSNESAVEPAGMRPPNSRSTCLAISIFRLRDPGPEGVGHAGQSVRGGASPLSGAFDLAARGDVPVSPPNCPMNAAATAKKSSPHPLTGVTDEIGAKRPLFRVGDQLAPLEGGGVGGLSFRSGLCTIHELSLDEPPSTRRDMHCRRYGITRIREV